MPTPNPVVVRQMGCSETPILELKNRLRLQRNWTPVSRQKSMRRRRGVVFGGRLSKTPRRTTYEGASLTYCHCYITTAAAATTTTTTITTTIASNHGSHHRDPQQPLNPDAGTSRVEAFKAFDSDGDGQLSAEELRQGRNFQRNEGREIDS